jgi:hypothetical protein
LIQTVRLAGRYGLVLGRDGLRGEHRAEHGRGAAVQDRVPQVRLDGPPAARAQYGVVEDQPGG